MKIYASLLIVLAVVSYLSCGGPDPNAGPSKYEQYLNLAEEVWQFHGAYLIARGDTILACGGRGLADIETGRPMTAETRFLIGSMTKPFTAVAVMQLVEQGLIEPEKTIADYLPDYPAEVAGRVTVHDLLAHRSGIPDPVSDPTFARRVSEEMTPDEIVTFFRDMPLEFEPGTQYAYSSANYILLGLIMEAVTGQLWEVYIQEHICKPLGMNHTEVIADYGDRTDFATGYAPGRSGQLAEAPALHPSCGYAAGALSSTVNDLYLLHRALYDTTFLRLATVDTMLRPHSPTYGYGWMVDDFGGHRLTAHGGGVPGYVSIWQRWVDDSVCVVVLSNNVTVPVHNIANALAAIAIGEPYEMPQVKTPVVVDSSGYDDYVEEYRLPNGELRSIVREGDQLAAVRGTGRPYYIQPEGKDKFYFVHDHMTTLEFFRDSTGAVAGHILRQAFDADTALRVESSRE